MLAPGDLIAPPSQKIPYLSDDMLSHGLHIILFTLWAFRSLDSNSLLNVYTLLLHPRFGALCQNLTLEFAEKIPRDSKIANVHKIVLAGGSSRIVKLVSNFFHEKECTNCDEAGRLWRCCTGRHSLRKYLGEDSGSPPPRRDGHVYHYDNTLLSRCPHNVHKRIFGRHASWAETRRSQRVLRPRVLLQLRTHSARPKGVIFESERHEPGAISGNRLGSRCAHASSVRSNEGVLPRATRPHPYPHPHPLNPSAFGLDLVFSTLGPIPPPVDLGGFFRHSLHIPALCPFFRTAGLTGPKNSS
ncbi:hypothetical protein B0H19DRAFT_1374378 [Mycena capillaripes]|nr:hypothetical protein B0H19DRAFT_1374378 [Mycena capillaripes]